MGSPIHRWAHPRTLHLLAYVSSIQFGLDWLATPAPLPFWLRSLSWWRPSRANFHAHEFVPQHFSLPCFQFLVLALTSLGNYTKFEEWKYHDSPCGIVSCFHFQPVNFLTQKRSPRNTGEDHVGGHVTAPNPREALDGLMREME